jgi:hypothetical protein
VFGGAMLAAAVAWRPWTPHDHVISVSNTDVAVNAATAEAQATLDQFFERRLIYLPEQRAFL